MDNANRPHMRSYQACRACRDRKIRCDRGPVDNPDPPPCARCRRESKECVFSSTRRRRRQNSDATEEDNPGVGSSSGGGGGGSGGSGTRTGAGGDSSDHEMYGNNINHGGGVYNGIGNKRPRPDHLDEMGARHGLSDLSAAGVHGAASQQLHQSSGPSSSASAQFGQGPVGSRARRNSRPTPPYDEEDEKKASNKATAILQTKEVFSGHDALNLLFEAAGRNGDIVHHRSGSGGSLPRPSFANANTPGSYSTLQSPQTNNGGGAKTSTPSREIPPSQAPAVDPAIGTNYAAGMNDLEESRAYEDAIRAWSRFRFVRAGWFTAREGIAYVDYFYEYLSPLTPIVVQDFQNHSLHGKLLVEEPLLVITMLTIASRYMKLAGPGATSRPFSIHQQLWQYLLGMVQRVIFSQEQFGGGFCGAGAAPPPPGNEIGSSNASSNGGNNSNSSPFYRKGLRTLGTIESLLLLTEWHPRALHFPPGDDNDELMVSDDTRSGLNVNNVSAFASDEFSSKSGSNTGPRVDSCMEPCWRSDRMTWMLLGNALTLAFELGVFDELNEYEFQEENPNYSYSDIQVLFQRRQNLRELLLIYITQTSGRLGLNTLLPRKYIDPYFSKTPEQRLRERMERLQSSALSNGTHEAHKRQLTTRDLVLYFWVEIAALFESGNQRLFQNRRYTREIITTGQYGDLLQYFQPVLQQWRRTFEEATGIPILMRHVLMIEYEYSRVYINSLALQAIVERCTNNTPTRTKQMSFEGGVPRADSKAIPFTTLMQWYGDDRKYIAEVTNGARNVLRVVVEGLYPNDYLKHAPVRTYFRIISVAIILLKTFALGATEDDVAISLGLMDRAVEAVRTCIVDDVHVGVRFADLLETLSSRIRSSFVRMSSGNCLTGMTTSRAQSRSPGLTAAAMAMAPMGPPPAPTTTTGGTVANNNGAFLTAQQPLNWSNRGNANANNGIGGAFNCLSPNSPSLTAGRMTPSHPLYGISTEPYDPGTGNVSIMPPPSFSIDSFGTASNGIYDGNNPASASGGGAGMNFIGMPGGTGVPDDSTGGVNGATAGGGSGGGGGPDWLALPLDPLLNSYGADVTQTLYGPDVGGCDLLDLLLGNLNNC